ncbi:ZnF C2H2 [Geosmithia morbida]|uniref:ZnF C2H2 n=1 Tax=Geosmithia morbida TaxID=1094350 RepID=A0A9P5CZA1_9HYPO|nr:ZnF C2H2 [Geosmithia morbida]KAF4120242.1 ZnF C2H2 [Geosmithia morbida]
MKPSKPIYRPSRSPSPEVTLPPVLFHSDYDVDYQYKRSEPRTGDAALTSLFGNYQSPHISQAADRPILPSINDLDDYNHRGDRQYDLGHDRSSSHFDTRGLRLGTGRDEPGKPRLRHTAPPRKDSLQHLAAGALKAVNVPETPSDPSWGPLAVDKLSLHDPPESPRYKSPSLASSRSRPSMLSPPTAPLPPLAKPSPSSDHSGHSLPSIRSTLGGDFKLALPEKEPTLPHHTTGPPLASYSPPSGAQMHPHIPCSSPISPPDNYSRSLPSPRATMAPSPYSHIPVAISHRPSVDYSGSSTCGESATMEKSLSSSGTAASVTTDCMSIDEITSQGGYNCTVTGCTAPPFQTQYLLNSHANVHSSARPHYCPVPGCARSEGGKGFKRKNEMIRHGLVHDSPGYVCPFCPDRDHKYPRPDNLQRHVRVHHNDKSKDDPLLREVLAQRADGPNRGRRRRGGS